MASWLLRESGAQHPRSAKRFECGVCGALTDKQLATAKFIKEGWLTPTELLGLEEWDKQTDWLNKAAGKKLSIEQKSTAILDLTSAAAIGLIGGRGFGGQSKNLAVKEAAAALGYNQRIPPQKAPFDSHGQSVFYNGKQYITRDIDAHNTSDGWEIFDKKGNRLGTFDENLNWIKN